MGIKEAFESFMAEEFKSAVISSTKASWGGSGYSVLLYNNGAYKVLWDKYADNVLDRESAVVIKVPPLSDEDYSEDPSECFFGYVTEALREKFLHFLATSEEIYE